ncbi:dihydrofolate reductase family protein [Massilia endophytica]|uniref:dihydrofolate reductase family protein n=1 Tax=Massilia endophytica TaxID=2899220 RepID=UPI001E47CA00|nr:dihydrofolate reductase family protein [Massilia endophytica]UGQ44576.1 dihydrofolate reductase family protein [Massilia endophytica]
MRKVVVTEFMSLDGVIESPEKWSFPYWNDEIENFKNAELAATGALLLGRNTYEAFAAAWPTRSGAFADRMNSLPKYVASSTLDAVHWQSASLLGQALPDAMAQLKQDEGKDIVVHGSAALAQSLMRHDLVDQYSLLVYPTILGTGKRLFKPGQQAKLKLAGSTMFSSGVVALTYHRAASEPGA